MENDNTQDVFGNWRPSALPTLTQVMERKIPISLVLPRGFDGKSQGLQLRVMIIDVEPKAFTVEIISRTEIQASGPAKMVLGLMVAEIFFIFPIKRKDGGFDTMAHTAEAGICDVLDDARGDPAFLSLRVPHAFKTRRMRKDERFDWRKDIPVTLGLDVCDFMPKDHKDLRDLLEHCADNNRRILFEPLNISAGGLCLLINPSVIRVNPSSLLFFLLSFRPDPRKPATPFFMLCRRLGLHYLSCNSRPDGIRMQFLFELDLPGSSGQLKWQNIEKSGSRGLRSTLGTLWKNGTPPQSQHPAAPAIP